MYKLYSKNEIISNNSNVKNSIIDFYLKFNRDIDGFCFLNDSCFFLSNNDLFQSSFIIENDKSEPFLLNKIATGIFSISASINGIYAQALDGTILTIDASCTIQKRHIKKNKFKNIYYSKNKACLILFDDSNFNVSGSSSPYSMEYEDFSTDIEWFPIDVLSEMYWYGYNKASKILYFYNNKSVFSYLLDNSTIGVFTAVIGDKSFVSYLSLSISGLIRCSILDLEILATCEPRFVFIPQGNLLSSDTANILDSSNLYGVINSIKITNMADDYIVKVG